MKACTKCHKIKALEQFFVKDRATGRLHAQCKDCYKEHRLTYAAAHYKKYGDAYRERAKIRRATVKKGLQAHMLLYLKDHPCTICGEDDVRTLEFDHLEPALKSFGIAKAITDGRKWADILIEIEKCRVLCANCHKKHTALQNNWYKV